MPIEIRELHIRVNADESPQQANHSQTNRTAQGAVDKEQLMQDCMDQISTMLKRKKER